jgi:hypothetical protein
MEVLPQMGLPQIIQVIRPWLSIGTHDDLGINFRTPLYDWKWGKPPIYCVWFQSSVQMILWVCFIRKKTVYLKFWPLTKKHMIGISQIWDDTEWNLWLRHQRDANNQNRTRWRCHVFFIPNMTCFFPIDFCICQGAAQTWSRVVFGGVQL